MTENNDNSKGLFYKQYLIDIRRERVLELAAQGLSQTEIASKINCSQALVSLDLQYLRSQAAAAINEYVTHTIPYEFQKALTGFSVVIKESFKISNDSTIDTRDKLAALTLVTTAYEKCIELLSNSTILSKAVESMAEMKNKVNSLKQEEQQTSEVF